MSGVDRNAHLRRPGEIARSNSKTGGNISRPPGNAIAADKRKPDPVGSRRGELLTWVVGFLIYTGWMMLTLSFHQTPVWLAALAGAWIIAWHGSLQHETVHGHPSGKTWLNSLLGYLPLGLVYPYPIYKRLHIKHHSTPDLTDPLNDPESFYVTQEDWQRSGPVRRLLLRFNNTLAGRMIIGPALTSYIFWGSEIRKVRDGDFDNAADWLAHLLLCGVVMWWVTGYCGISFFHYLFCFVYPGHSLTLLRSYIEHRPEDTQKKRSVIVETSIPFQLLFLNNSYHFVHHENPSLPWYALKELYSRTRENVLAANGKFMFRGYSEIIRLYAFKMNDAPVVKGPAKLQDSVS